MYIKVSNGAKIRNRYNQVPHLTQDTNGKNIKICKSLWIKYCLNQKDARIIWVKIKFLLLYLVVRADYSHCRSLICTNSKISYYFQCWYIVLDDSVNRHCIIIIISSWLAVREADLTSNLQVFLSWGLWDSTQTSQPVLIWAFIINVDTLSWMIQRTNTASLSVAG